MLVEVGAGAMGTYDELCLDDEEPQPLPLALHADDERDEGRLMRFDPPPPPPLLLLEG